METCTRCGAFICALCAATSAPAVSAGRAPGSLGGSRTFFHMRVAALLACSPGCLLYAGKDVLQRRARNEWNRTLEVGLVVVRLGPVDGSAIDALRERVRTLEDILAAEAARYRGPEARVLSRSRCSARGRHPAAADAGGDGVIDLAAYAYAKFRYAASIDEAGGVSAGSTPGSTSWLARAGRARRTSSKG